MTAKAKIKQFIADQPDATRSDVESLHQHILKLIPEAKLWFDEGVDAKGKVVTNPTIGYGSYAIRYANGTSKEFFQIGISPNKSGISLYIMGIKDRSYLRNTYSNSIGKAAVTGYCVKFKKLTDLKLDVLDEAILYGVSESARS
jgi:hypothetical protein